jgi:hypothetical protein
MSHSTKKQLINYSQFLLLLVAFIGGCVSVKIGGVKTKKAEGVVFLQPRSPFAEVTLPASDHAWTNKQNGNTISYSSSCDDASEPTLDSAKNDLLSNLSELKIISEQSGMFNSRESESASARGTVDGVKTQVEILVFSKDNCLYSLSYVGVDSSFSQNLAQYREFLQSFKAP